jgi:hypothetical protein
MPPKKSKPSSPRASAPAQLEAFLAAMEHPHKQAIFALRAIISSVDRRIREDIKWNAPSFHTSEHFATFNLRHTRGVQIVLHLGAKAKANSTLRADVADPESILEWRGVDRATVTFVDLADVEAKESALRGVLQQWIARL